MKNIKNLIYILIYLTFALAAILVYKSIIPVDIFVYGYTYSFILYMLFEKVKNKSKVNAKIFAGILFSLLGLSYTTPNNSMIIGITLFLLAYFTISNLIRYIKDYNTYKNDNSFPIVALSSLMIVILYLFIAMKIFT